MAKTYLENQIWSSLGASGLTYEEAYEAFAEGFINSLKKHYGVEDPHAIQPADESFECCICGKYIENEYSHNAQPVKDGRCCIECNALKVIPARLKEMGVK